MEPDCTWETPRRAPLLRPGEVHVWRVSLAASPELPELAAGFLSDDETERARRFHFAVHRDRYLAGRLALRRLLGGYLGSGPGDVAFAYSAQGKPRLRDWHGSALRFNVSNSADLALIAVAAGQEVGIDVEQLRADSDPLSVPEAFFTPAEVEWIRHSEDRVRAFFTCWVRKEAALKAWGTGLALALDSFDVLPATAPAARIRHPHVSGEWTLRNLVPGDGYAAALVVEGGDFVLRCWQG
jgi:4'-phosphopantetheinyl transferase